MSKLPGLLLCLILALPAIGCESNEEGSLKPDGPLPNEPNPPELSSGLKIVFPKQSAGVLIGVEEFQYLDGNQNVLYAVNDAIDLAYALAIEHRLLPANRVRLLLSGEPSGGSVQRLAELVNGDALTGPATNAAIKTALREQADLVGPKGVLYVFLATHGYFDEGQYFLAHDSHLDSQETALSEEQILEITQARSGGQTLLIQDTCRIAFTPEGPQRTASSAESGSRSVVPVEPDELDKLDELKRALTRRRGHAVLLATGPREPAWPDPERRNGFFTGAILDALRCEKLSTKSTVISVVGLSSLVQVTARERSGGRQRAQLLLAEGFEDLPLVRCGQICRFLEPRVGQIVPLGSGVVKILCDQPDLYAAAVLYAESNGVYFNQQPNYALPVMPGAELRIPVQYGGPVSFQVYVGLSYDPNFLAGQFQLRQLPSTDSHGQLVHWLGPVAVTVKTSS